MTFEWELIYSEYSEQTFRAKVIGGWLVRHSWREDYSTMVFIPDAHHHWSPE